MEIDPGTGRFYIEIGWNDLLSLAPDISGDLVERVTWSETINRGFRTEGLYRHERAELVVKTEEETDYDGMDKTRTSHQVISVSGPSVDTARKIYSLVRQLKLQPEENWEVKPEKKEPPKEPATETAAPAKS